MTKQDCVRAEGMDFATTAPIEQWSRAMKRVRSFRLGLIPWLCVVAISAVALASFGEAQPANQTDQVSPALELKGTESYVELPPNIYKGLTQATFVLSPAWYANAWLIGLGLFAISGLAFWAVTARVLYARKRREAEALREQMLEQERHSRETLEAEMGERKRAQEYYHSLVESIPHIVIRKDRQGRYTFVNSNSREFAGFKGLEMLGHDDSLWAPAELAAQIKAADEEVITTGKSVEMVRAIELPNAPRMFLHSIRSPIRDEQGTIVGVQMVAWDVTHEKEAEEALRTAKNSADEANHAKSQFLANMSHELRTPLNASMGYSEMLQEEAEDLGTRELVPDLQKIHGAGKHLLGLINDILDLSKIEAGKMTVYNEDFEVPQMVKDVATTVHPLIVRNGNTLE